MPRLLTNEQKKCRKKVSIQCLAKFHSNKAEILHQFITMDETWIHYSTLETKEQSKQWSQIGKFPPEKGKEVPSRKDHGVFRTHVI